MLIIETDEPPRTELCQCCGGTTTWLTRFVYSDDDAFAVYYAAFSDEHLEREITIAIGIGEWGDESTADDRRSFALVMRETETELAVTVTDAEESPWRNSEIIGRMLDRDEALAHPLISDVFHITDHMVTDDPEIRAYFERQPPSDSGPDLIN